ncbi:hypothetical protein ABPG77_007128 [Micractinium sp. CCAP 211/92]
MTKGEGNRPEGQNPSPASPPYTALHPMYKRMKQTSLKSSGGKQPRKGRHNSGTAQQRPSRAQAKETAGKMAVDRLKQHAHAAHADVTGKIREAVEAGAGKELPTGDSYDMLPAMFGLQVEAMRDASGTMHDVVAAADQVPAFTVFKMQGREITTAESEALEAADTTGERMDCLHVINDKVVLDVFDTQYSCALRLVKRAEHACRQNVRTEEYGGAVYLITTRDINRGEPLLGYWEWEADDETRTRTQSAPLSASPPPPLGSW